MIQTKESITRRHGSMLCHETKALLLILLLNLIGLNVSAQKQDALDSTLYYLNQLSGVIEKDSVIYREMTNNINSFKPEFLADKRYEQALLRLKSTLTPAHYYTIAYNFLAHANYSSRQGEYDYPINYGLKFIEELKSNPSQHQRFIFLKAMRDIRVPFRNSARIYEGIEIYSNLASYLQQRGDSAGVSIAQNVLASFYQTIGLADKAVYFQLKSIDYLDEKIYPVDSTYLSYGSPPNIGLPGKINRKGVLASYLIDDGDYSKAVRQLHEAIALSRKQGSGRAIIEASFVYLQMARAHVYLETDSADHYFALMREAFDDPLFTKIGFAHYFQEKSFGFYMAGKLDSAEVNIEKCIDYMTDNNLGMTNIMGSLTPGYYLGLIRIKQNRFKEAIAALQPEIVKLRALNLRRETLSDMKLLAEAYTFDGDYQNATKAYEAYSTLSNEMIEEERNNRSLSFDIEKRMAENEKAVQLLETENKYNQKRQYYLLGILGLLSLLAFGLLTRNRYKQKVNKELIRKNKEIETTLTKLQSTQAQLIHSEKMASLGELTAGIAHEIQNPLNFVNNFSEVNAELIDELQHELNAGNTTEAIAISQHIKDNEQKINHHGKRADAIVKGMLQHSRSGSGIKEPTDINALAEEYLRLAYHGLRAKDKSFNATMKTDFDDSIGMISVIPQEIGRVILNLITNAFYVVNEKKKLQPNGFEPTVAVTTKKADQHIIVTVKDNGNGIPKEAMDKIFQPFFTTKPTGQGTGLGLSLSYDIVKVHGGELKVETKEGEGSVFVIQIPV